MGKGNSKKIITAFMAVVMLVTSLLPYLAIPIYSADGEADFTFDSGAVLIDSSYNGKNILIKNGVFSVAVNGATDVNIIFQDVTIDRRYASDTENGQTINNLYEVSQALGWGTTAQVCPLLITGNSDVTVAFRGTNTFYAGVNGCTVSTAGVYTASQSGGGFAGVQVDSGSSLTIEYGNLSAYGGHYVDGDNSNNYGYGYSFPSGASATLAGGAGIGGGVTYDTTSSYGRYYTQGTPGTITINGGTINAYGGHQAAGIGGGINGAATSSSININGGDITVCGGRWAAGIGDGDSLQDGYSGDFANSYSINIHGGTVNAIGGVACPGIGSTDSLAYGVTTPATSGLEITIDGGTVMALPGYPDGFNPGGTTGYSGNDAAAAIGAGNKTNMQSNSISITSDAEILASAFGHYSITENGTSHDARPNVNIDSDGYLYLGRFPDLVDSTSRTFELYEAQDEIIDGYVYRKYVTQPADGSIGKVYYVCAGADKPLLNSSKEEVKPAADQTYDQLFEELKLTVYVDESSVLIKSVTVLKHFRSIALTLPKPEEHGGLYALKIPCESLYAYDGSFELPKSGFVTVTVSADDSGTISGKLAYPQADNISLDSVTAPFIDLDVYRDGQHTDGSDGLIGSKFFMNVYAYTVYIENTDDTAYLYGQFSLGSNSYCSIALDDTAISFGTNDYFTAEVDMTGLNEKVVRIRKTDTVDGNQSNSIVYKITIIRKSVYQIDLKNLSKVYDGVRVTPSINEIYAGTRAGYEVVHTENTSDTTTYTVDPSTGATISATGGTFGYYSKNKTASISVNTSCSVDASEAGKLIYKVTVTVAKISNADIIVSSNKFVFTVKLNQGATIEGNASSTQVASYKLKGNTTYYFNLVADSAGKISINYNNENPIDLFSLNLGSLSESTIEGDESEKNAAESAANNAVASGATSGEWSYTVSSAKTYEGKVTANVYKTTFTATSNTNSSENAGSDARDYTTSVESTTTGKYSIEQAGGSSDYETIEVTTEELNSAVYSFYSSTDGGSTWLPLTNAPKDAGMYKVSALIEAESYTASGEKVFIIEQRPLRVLGIANYLRYVTSSEYATLTAPCPIADPGEFILDNVISADKGNVIASAYPVYYNDISIGFGQTKITLEGVVLSGDAAHNYTTDATQQVPGQLSYTLDGAIFRKKPGQNWDKFYPIDSPDPVSSDTADYHSPVNNGVYDAHADYVYARTTGKGDEGTVYAVDIEFGAMYFTYSKSRWDPNNLVYEELENESKWDGFDGVNNRIEISNRSNKAVRYSVDPKISFLHSSFGNDQYGISAKMYDVNTTDGTDITNVFCTLTQATAGDAQQFGQSSKVTCYLRLSGIPQFGESSGYTVVGQLTVTITK